MSQATKPIKVVLADDNTDLTSVLSKLFEFEPDIECVSRVANAQDIIDEVIRTKPTVLVIDLSLPGGDSETIIRQLQAVAPAVRAIVYSGYDDDERIQRMLDAGAWQFVCKDAGPNKLVTSIRTVASGPAPTPPARMPS